MCTCTNIYHCLIKVKSILMVYEKTCHLADTKYVYHPSINILPIAEGFSAMGGGVSRSLRLTFSELEIVVNQVD